MAVETCADVDTVKIGHIDKKCCSCYEKSYFRCQGLRKDWGGKSIRVRSQRHYRRRCGSDHVEISRSVDTTLSLVRGMCDTRGASVVLCRDVLPRPKTTAVYRVDSCGWYYLRCDIETDTRSYYV